MPYGFPQELSDNLEETLWKTKMKIHSIEVQNFRGFEKISVDLHPEFTLLIGENASGKTSLLSALSVALGIWHVSSKGKGWRNILPHEIRLAPQTRGDRPSFEPCEPVIVTAKGEIGGTSVTWLRMIKERGKRTTNANAKEAIELIEAEIQESNVSTVLPVLAFYGSGRSWIASNERLKQNNGESFKPSRWEAYYGCLNERIRMKDLVNWFVRESASRDARGRFRYGYEVVRYALTKCIPGAQYVGFDHHRLEPIITMENGPVLFSNLSDGQKSMAALVADIAIKAVTLNSHLAPAERSDDRLVELPEILRQTPGVVLVDELDVHLHPKWQRHVIRDLRSVFPAIQFVCSSHSPQIIGELSADHIRVLADGNDFELDRAMGLSSNQILEELMGAKARNEETEELIRGIARLIDDEHFEKAKQAIESLAKVVGDNDPAVIESLSTISFLEADLK